MREKTVLIKEGVRPLLSSSRTAFSVLDDDAALLKAARTGERSALSLLLTRHESALLRLSASVLGSVSGHDAVTEAADAVQETFLRALRVLMTPSGFRNESSVRTWLFRIAINVCLESRRRPATVSLTPHAEARLPADAQSSPDETVINRMRIAEALSELQPRQRVLLILREQEGWSASEIAPLFGWKEKRVHNELFKMRQRLLKWRTDEESGINKCDQ